MNDNFQADVAAEVQRISALPLDEQPAAFAELRDQLEKALNQSTQDSAE